MITNKRPFVKQTVGAQYICFASAISPALVYSTDVEKTETVKSIKTTESSETGKVFASGKLYDSSVKQSSIEVAVEVVAFVAETLAKMRAEIVETGGLVLSGSSTDRPYFAYGKVVELKGAKRFEWFPKCQLVSNTDDTSSSEESFSEQNDTLTITAMPFDEAGNIKVYVQTDMTVCPEWMTEDLFFSVPILDQEMLTALDPTP